MSFLCSRFHHHQFQYTWLTSVHTHMISTHEALHIRLHVGDIFGGGEGRDYGIVFSVSAKYLNGPTKHPTM